jgi:hypothetical protein
MAVHFNAIAVGSQWGRKDLAEIWDYEDFHALARGIITPANDNKIVFFITHEKQSHSSDYRVSYGADVTQLP